MVGMAREVLHHLQAGMHQLWPWWVWQEKCWIWTKTVLLQGSSEKLLKCPSSQTCTEMLLCTQGKLSTGGSANPKRKLYICTQAELHQCSCTNSYQGCQEGLQWWW